ncbi:MAG: hypothetical protein EBT09_01185 [Actinobacteria bacterium]|nr:hypothetical protein [Actinomycetota bacterium]
MNIILNRLRTGLLAGGLRAAIFGLWGFGGAVLADALIEPILSANMAAIGGAYPHSILYFGMGGASVCTAISACHLLQSGLLGARLRALATPGLVGLVVGAIGGVAATLIFSSVDTSAGSRLVSWGLCGALLGFGVAPQLPNLPRERAALGGGIGGVAGCLIFLQLTDLLSASSGRMIGIGMIGLFMGVMIVFTDALLREAWLEVILPNGRMQTLTLGDKWVSLGTDERAVSVYAVGAPLIGLRYRLVNGAVICEDASKGFGGNVPDGDRRMTGSVTAVVRSFDPSRALPPPPTTRITPAPGPSPRPSPTPSPSPPAKRTVSIRLVRDVCRIGSAPTSEVLVTAKGVAPHHADVRRSNGQVEIIPVANSRIDVSISGREIDFERISGPKLLHEHSRMRIGDAEAVFLTGPARFEITS